MTAPALFTYEGRQVRTVVVDDEPWFVAADVCAVLGIVNARDAISRLDDDEKGVGTTDTPGGPQQVAIVSEAGVYGLTWTSRKDEAAAFRRWIKHEVLPQIRRTGGYGAPGVQIDLANRDHINLIVQAAHAQMLRADEAEARVAELEPVAGRLLNADGDYSVADAAKALTRAGVKTGPARLFGLLEQRGWIYRSKGDGRWRVMQTAIESGVMSVIPQSHYHPKTGVLVLDPPQPRVTPKGIQKLLASQGAEVAVRP